MIVHWRQKSKVSDPEFQCTWSLFNLTDPENNLSGVRASGSSLLQHYAAVHRKISDGENVADDNDHRHYGKRDLILKNNSEIYFNIQRFTEKTVARS